MSRFRHAATLVLSFAAIASTGAWTGRALAAWASHAPATAPAADVVSSHALTALSGATAIPSTATVKHGVAQIHALGHPMGLALHGNGLPSLVVAPFANLGPSGKSSRELDNADPWNGRLRAPLPPAKRLEMEATDPWNAGIAAMAPPRVRARMVLDAADPWTGLLPLVSPNPPNQSEPFAL